jgi:hypothetical protein
MPVGATLPVAVGDVGVDDAAILLEPEPHIPDNPDVSGVPEVVDTPDDIELDVPGMAMSPDVAAVAGAAAPAAVPPPSKLAVDPNVSEGEVPMVEHVVPLLGMEIVPVTPPVGAGLTPGDAISVAPRGIPVPPTGAPGLLPSGEVMPSAGVGATVPTCAKAGPQPSKADVIVA